MRRVVLLLTISAALAGCMPTPEQQAIESKQDLEQCKSLGAKPGTDIMTQCRLALYQKREGERERARQAMGDALGAMGGAMIATGSRPTYAPAPSSSCNVMPNGIGGYRVSC